MKPSVFKFEFFFTVDVFWLWPLCTAHMHVNKTPGAWPLCTKWDTCACLTKCDGMKPIVSSSACYLGVDPSIVANIWVETSGTFDETNGYDRF